jgi:hypothetical protein
LLFFAQWQLKGIELNSPSALSDNTVRWILGTSSVIRNLLSFWVIACTLGLAWQLEWPAFKFNTCRGLSRHRAVEHRYGSQKRVPKCGLECVQGRVLAKKQYKSTAYGAEWRTQEDSNL